MTHLILEVIITVPHYTVDDEHETLDDSLVQKKFQRTLFKNDTHHCEDEHHTKSTLSSRHPLPLLNIFPCCPAPALLFSLSIFSDPTLAAENYITPENKRYDY